MAAMTYHQTDDCHHPDSAGLPFRPRLSRGLCQFHHHDYQCDPHLILPRWIGDWHICGFSRWLQPPCFDQLGLTQTSTVLDIFDGCLQGWVVDWVLRGMRQCVGNPTTYRLLQKAAAVKEVMWSLPPGLIAASHSLLWERVDFAFDNSQSTTLSLHCP